MTLLQVPFPQVFRCETQLPYKILFSRSSPVPLPNVQGATKGEDIGFVFHIPVSAMPEKGPRCISDV